MKRIDLITQECIAHVKPNQEPKLEVVDMYGKTYITDDHSLEDGERVFRDDYEIVHQYYDKLWHDMPTDSVGISIVRLKQLKTREILRKQF